MRRLNVIGAAMAAAASILILAAPMAAAENCGCPKLPVATPLDDNGGGKRPLITAQDSSPMPRPLDVGPIVKRPLATPQDGNTHFPRPL
jgi:hypothetical protein